MRGLIEDILYGRRNDAVTLPFRMVLRGLSAVYGVAVSFRVLLYSRGYRKSGSVPCRVVSVGNITVGGTGKTPVVIMTARMLAEAGFRTAVVSRGYRRERDEPLVVSDGKTVLASPLEAGDEPHLAASSLPGVPVVVGRKRHAAARLAWKRFHPEIIVLDDAFQHLALRRDMDIITLDAESPFGNGKLLPRGTLREPLRALSRAHAAVVTRFAGETSSPELERAVRRFHPGIPVFYSRHVPRAVRRLSDDEEFSPESLIGKKIAALSNIANPVSFHRMLESLGGEIVWKCIRPDHHRYRPGEPEEIGWRARECGAGALVMTAKDERNLPESHDFAGMEAFVLDIESVLVNGEKEYLKQVASDLIDGS